jgi:hypothetical protein
MLTVVLVMVVPRPGKPQVNVAFAFVDERFPVRLIDDAKRVEGAGTLGGGYAEPLIDETVSWGVDTQLLPVTKVPLTWLEPTRVLKFADRPNTC